MKKTIKLIIGIISLCICAFLYFENGTEIDVISSYKYGENAVRVHFIDVGQADSLLIELPYARAILIDAGNNDDGYEVINYIKNKGITKLDAVIGTHPHEDHIGGLDDVIDNIDTGEVYMPKVQTNTKTFRDVLTSVSNKGLKVKTAKAGVNILSEDNLSVDIIAPVSDKYEELNNYSAVVRVKYDEKTFLFMADAEMLSEDEITSDVKADVLKVGHHGSSTSTGRQFLQKVSPEYAFISCGAGNSYGHPHKETMELLNKEKIKIYRSDKDGTVIFETDGKNLRVVD